MARKKQPAKPLAGLRFDFFDSLENVCNQAMAMLQAVDALVLHADDLRPAVRDLLAERSKALREALIGTDEGGSWKR